MPEHRSREFWPAAEQAFQAMEKRKHEARRDFVALCDAFETDDNKAWAELSPSTQRGYKGSLARIRELWGDELPAEITTPGIQAAIDDLSDKPATANQFRACLSRLIAWGIPRGYSSTNPVSHTEKIPGGEPWVPWPGWAFETLLEHGPFHLVFPAVTAFFTGQRQGDVLAMTRPREKDGLIEVRAQKTDKTVWIPVHSAYQTWIDRAPKKDTVQMHIGARGRPYATADGFRTEWQKMMAEDAFKRFRKERIVFHGLRKNAVINLLEVGCTEAQVGAIVNMSEQMVRHYGREVSVKALARDGMKLLESRWSDVSPVAFGKRTERELKTAL